jgi:hypothetical protein
MKYYKNLNLSDIKYFCEIDHIEKIEQWLPVIGYEYIYEVSDLGRIKSCDGFLITHSGVIKKRKSIILSQQEKQNKYLSVSISINNCEKRFYVHRLVAISFIKNPLNLAQVNHKDLDRKNNMKTNIEWNSSKQNLKHGILYNREILNNITDSNKNKFKTMIQLDMNDNIIEEHENGILASIKTGICERNIYQVASKTEYKPGFTRKQAGGYKWKYRENV